MTLRKTATLGTLHAACLHSLAAAAQVVQAVQPVAITIVTTFSLPCTFFCFLLRDPAYLLLDMEKDPTWPLGQVIEFVSYTLEVNHKWG